jgi:DNA polymerase-1
VIVGWDIETRGTNPWRKDFRLVSSCWYQNQRTKQALLLEHSSRPPIRARPDVAHSPRAHGKVLDDVQIVRLHSTAQILDNPLDTVCGHTISYDVTCWQAFWGCTVNARLFDTAVARMLVDENVKRNSLEACAQHYLGYGKLDVDSRQCYALPADEVLAYNMRDAELSKRLWQPLVRDMTKEGVMGVFNFYMDLLPHVVALQMKGVRLDKRWTNEQASKLAHEVDQLDRSIGKVIGRVVDPGVDKLMFAQDNVINLDSDQQLGKVLFEEFKFPVHRRTQKTGRPGVAKGDLKEIRKKVDKKGQKLIDLLLERSRVTKLLGTYIDPYLTDHLGTDGRVHTNYRVSRGFARKSGGGTVTGRLSSYKPNLTNVPRDPLVKGCFVPTRGMRFADADYSQVELRVAGWLSQDPVMQSAFQTGRDLHCVTLAGVESVPYGDVVSLVVEDEKWKDKRSAIKTFNFAMLYGAGIYKLQEIVEHQAGVRVSMPEVRRFWHKWNDVHRGFRAWQRAVHQLIQDEGFVVNEFGMKRRLLTPGEDISQAKMGALLRQGLNFLIQSIAAQITEQAIVALSRFDWDVVLTVHDSVVVEYNPKSERLSEAFGIPHMTKKSTEAILKHLLVSDPRRGLEQHFGVDLSDLHLDVDVKAGLTRWGQ